MIVKKITSWVLLLLIIISAAGGIAIMTGAGNKSESNYSDVQLFAEYISKIYLTLDSESEKRKKQLEKVAPIIVEVMEDSTETKQWVQHVKAGEVENYVEGRYHAKVEAWTLAVRKAPDEGEEQAEEELYVPRRYVIELDIVRDPSEGYIVSGLPKIKEIPIAITELPKVEELALDKELIKPILNATLPSVLSGDISKVINYFTDDAEIETYPGSYIYQKIIGLQIYEAGKNQYRVLSFIKALDPVTEVSLGMKITMDVVDNNGKFYIKKIY